MAKQTDDTYKLMQDYWINPTTRELWMQAVDGTQSSDDDPGIDYQMTNRVIKNLYYLAGLDAESPVTIHMIVNGGHVNYGLALYDAIRTMPYHVTAIVHGWAPSMAGVVLQAADHRVMMPSAYFMFHLGSLALDGDARGVFANSDQAKRENDRVLDIYTDATAGGEKFKCRTASARRTAINRAMERNGDVYLDAYEAVYWGFADATIDM